MFRSRKATFTIGGVLLASVLVFGFDGTYHRLSAALDDVREFINDKSSVDHLLKVGRKQLSEAEERLLDAEAAAKGYHDQQGRVRAEIARLQNAAAAGRERLEALRPALTSNSGFTHASCQFSAADVRQDALQLASFVKQCDTHVALRQEELKQLSQVLTAGDNTLLEARAEFAKAQARFQELEIKLTQQQAVAEATSAARAARQDLSTELGGDLAGTLGSLEKRLNRLQRQNDSVRGSNGAVPVGNIPFGPAAGTDALSLVNEVLGGKAPEAPGAE